MSQRPPLLRVAALLALLVLTSCGDDSAPSSQRVLRVAVAANFVETFDVLAERFQERHPDIVIRRSLGSTGGLYAQITHGAPFDLFLAADQDRPARLQAEGLGAADGRITYAWGRLALVATPGRDFHRIEDLTDGRVRHVAIANPKTAPYGVAAMEVLDHLGLTAALTPKLVRGNDVAQTLQFVATAAADGGFVALSQALAHPSLGRIEIPRHLHSALAQDALLLRESRAGRRFFRFLTSPEAAAILTARGYGRRED